MSHKTLSELHPADIADIIEQLDPRLRTQVFAQLDTEQAAAPMTELDDDELMTEMLEGLSDREASTMLATMDPDDAAALIEELDYEKAEKLLRLMGVKEEKAIRNLLGYEEDTAGRIMTNQFVALPATSTVQDAIDALRALDEDFESIYYVYTTDADGALAGVLSMRTLVVAEHTDRLKDLAYRDVVWVAPDLDQEEVADEMTKYDLVAIPVCDENRHILGIVTVDDALDVIAEEHAEDLQIAGVSVSEGSAGESTHAFSWFAQRQYLDRGVGHRRLRHRGHRGDARRAHGRSSCGGDREHRDGPGPVRAHAHLHHARGPARLHAHGLVCQEQLSGI